MWNRAASNSDEELRIAPSPSVATAPAVATPAIARHPVDEERRLVAWVGKSVFFKGGLISLEDMTIDGRVEGTIEMRDHILTIGPDASVQADIVAKAVSIHGKVTGSITASLTVSIAETGSVEGNITSRLLAMADGATVIGRVHTSGRSTGLDAKTSQATAAL